MFIIPLAALLVCAVASCGDDAPAKKPTPTTAKSSATTEAEASSQTTSTIGQFEATVAAQTTALLAAGNDFCKVTDPANSTNGGGATTSADIKALYGYYDQLFNKIAEVMPQETVQAKTDAQVLRDAAAKMIKDAEAASYAPTLPHQPEAFSTAQVSAVLDRLGQVISTTCGTPAGA